MYLTKGRVSCAGMVLAILILFVSLAVSTRAVAQEGKTLAVGKKVLKDMAITVELEAPKRMQMMMGMGEWKTMRPKPGALTHHLTVTLAVPETGQPIPYANIVATIFNARTKTKLTKKLPPMFGRTLIYGVNMRLDAGKYDLLLKVEPPTSMRIEGTMNKWLEPIQATFAFVVK